MQFLLAQEEFNVHWQGQAYEKVDERSGDAVTAAGIY